MDRWSRRQFVQGVGAAGLGLVAGCGRLPGQIEQPTRVPRIGMLEPYSAGDGPITASIEAFRQELHERGYTEGQNLAIEYRFSGGDDNRLPDLAAGLIRLPVDVL